jgi:hypothetical protein
VKELHLSLAPLFEEVGVLLTFEFGALDEALSLEFSKRRGLKESDALPLYGTLLSTKILVL